MPRGGSQIQRPGVRDQIVNDLDALEEVANFIDAHTEVGKRYEFGHLQADLRRSLLRELGFSARSKQPHPAGRKFAVIQQSDCSSAD